MAGPVPAIYALLADDPQEDVDARDRRGHDESLQIVVRTIQRAPGGIRMKGSRIVASGVLCTVMTIAAPCAAYAEAGALRVSKGFGIHYLALYVMEKLQLVEKRAAAAGLGDIKVTYSVIDGGNVINDAML